MTDRSRHSCGARRKYATAPRARAAIIATHKAAATDQAKRDGTEIFYLAPDYKLMAAAVNGKGGSFEPGPVKPLFQSRVLFGARYAYDVSADGQRFLITVPQQTASAPITVVVNWQAGLKR